MSMAVRPSSSSASGRASGRTPHQACRGHSRVTACKLCFVVCILFGIHLQPCRSHGDHDNENIPADGLDNATDEPNFTPSFETVEETHNHYVQMIFARYGDGNSISFEGFEHLMNNLKLGNLKIDDHKVNDHFVNGSFREIHPNHEHSKNNTLVTGGEHDHEHLEEHGAGHDHDHNDHGAKSVDHVDENVDHYDHDQGRDHDHNHDHGHAHEDKSVDEGYENADNHDHGHGDESHGTAGGNHTALTGPTIDGIVPDGIDPSPPTSEHNHTENSRFDAAPHDHSSHDHDHDHHGHGDEEILSRHVRSDSMPKDSNPSSDVTSQVYSDAEDATSNQNVSREALSDSWPADAVGNDTHGALDEDVANTIVMQQNAIAQHADLQIESPREGGKCSHWCDRSHLNQEAPQANMVDATLDTNLICVVLRDFGALLCIAGYQKSFL